MSAAFSIGVTLAADTSATKATVTEKLETKTYLNSNGTFGGAATFDPIVDFSAEGVGTNPYTLTSTSFGSLSGKIVIETVVAAAKNDDFQTWKVSGKAYPSAS
jgi:adenosylcobinamide amidohydrolase